MSQVSEQQWRDLFSAAADCYQQLKSLAESSMDEPVDAGPALQQWTDLMRALNIDNLSDNPEFTAPFFEQLEAMNNSLKTLFTQRRDDLGKALKQQKKAHSGINAYRDL